MKKNNKVLLQNPQGTESFCMEEAALHRQISAQLTEIPRLWGYLPVQTPIFDFFDIYSDVVNPEDVYRLIDREGDLLLLRSDVTLFLAKQIAVLLEKENLPLRVFYSDTILRHESKIDISKNEFFQTGAELFGIEGEKGDLEILFLLEEMLCSLPIKNFLHLGSRKLFNLCFSSLPVEVKGNLATAIGHRDFDKMVQLLKNFFTDDEITSYRDLFSFIGTSQEFSHFVESLVHQPIREEASYIAGLCAKTEKLFPQAAIRVDTSEIGERPYYTGMVFRAYTEYAATEIACGGRYDTLLEHFGKNCPSVGFSLMQRKIESLPALKKLIQLPKTQTLSGDDLSLLYQQAKILREKGEIIKLC